MKVSLVAQTPFQLFGALTFACLADVEADLWLVDPVLLPLEERCRELGLFARVEHVATNLSVAGSGATGDIRSRATTAVRSKLIKSQISRYVRSSQPEAVVIFADNHEVLAGFAREAKQSSAARVIMGEEGVSSMFSYRGDRVSAIHGAARRIAGVDNPYGYGVGWSPHVDAVIVSDSSFAHPDFTGSKEVYEYPPGPYPDEPLRVFSNVIGLDGLAAPEPKRDIFVLGQPWFEVGILAAEEERTFLRNLDNSCVAERILLKPHPFDSMEKYAQLRNIHVLDSAFRSVPAEVLLGAWRPKATLSVFSSATLNYCARYDRPGILMAGAWLSSGILEKMQVLSRRHTQLHIADYLDDVGDHLARVLDLANPPSDPADSSRWRSAIAEVLAGDLRTN